MKEQDELVVLQRAKEKYPNETPRIITDNGVQFVAKDFKEFIRICGMTHVRTSPYYPQSNGKLERFHGSIKGECLRPGTPLSLEDALRIVGRYVEHYNHVRLHSAIGYVPPADKLAGRETEIFAARDCKLAEARERRKIQRERRGFRRLPERTRDDTMNFRPGRRIGLRREPTRAPTQGPRPKVGRLACAGRPPPFGIGTKAKNPRGSGGRSPSIRPQQPFYATNPTPDLPFHAEPGHPPHGRQRRLGLHGRLDPSPFRSHAFLPRTGPILPGIRLKVVVQFLGCTIPRGTSRRPADAI